jgi:hypothetical protein
MNLRRHLAFVRTVIGLALLVLLAGLTAPAHAQSLKPTDPLLLGPAASPVDDNRPVDSIENEYLKVEVNERGQFVIKTTGGDPDVIGDEDKVLLYDGTVSAPPQVWDGDDRIWGTSFATFRRYITPLGAWSHQANNDPRGLPDQRTSGDEITSVWLVENVCAFVATQTLSFMKNPYTGREDMVRIEYEFQRAMDVRPGECPDPLHAGRIGARLMLDTMIGDNDFAPFFIPGLGTTSNQHEFGGDAIPPFFRVFEDPAFSPDSLQAIGHILRSEPDPNRPNPDRFIIANWGSIYQRDDHLAPFDDDLLWDYTVPEGTEHGDSAIALYWSDHTIGSTAASNPLWFRFGYGLAPQGGGASWIDGQAVEQSGDFINCFSWVNNVTEETYSNGIVSIQLPPGLALAEEVNTASGHSLVQAIGDVAPGETAQVSWKLRATGGPGVYTYTTTAEFESGQVFTSTSEVSVEQALKYAATSYSVAETAGSIQIAVERTNSNGEPVTVEYAVVSDTATAGADFTAAEGALSFAAGSTAETFTIDILDDAETEGNETLVLSLRNPSANAALVDQGQILVTILDDEAAAPEQPVFLPLLVK